MFTKGPWKAWQERAPEGPWFVEMSDGSNIGIGHLATGEPDEANARLIAAAPEMYEALNICLGHLTGGMDGNWADCDPIDGARKALAKAEGKE